MARKQDIPEKDMKAQVRGLIKTKARKQKEPEYDKGFMKHTQKGKC